RPDRRAALRPRHRRQPRGRAAWCRTPDARRGTLRPRRRDHGVRDREEPVMRYFVARGESRVLDASARAGQRGDFATLSDGGAHLELARPRQGAAVVLVPGLTIPLGFWDAVVGPLHDRGLRTLTYS